MVFVKFCGVIFCVFVCVLVYIKYNKIVDYESKQHNLFCSKDQ